MSRIFLDVVERHTDEAAFLWEQRERAARSPLFDLPSLGAFDDRLAANLEGLVVAGPEGLRLCIAAFERATRSTEGPDGELFAASYVAAELGDNVVLSKLIALAQRGLRLERALVSALTWLSARSARRVLSELFSEECPPALHRLGIAASEARREDPGTWLARALASNDAQLCAVACRAAGYLGRGDLLPALQHVVRTPDEAARGWAAWALVLLGERGSLDDLWRVVAEVDEVGLAASDLAARNGEPRETAEKLAALAASELTLPAALAGAAALGDPSCVAWVLDVVDRSPTLARRAAWVYATITGVKVEPPLFVRSPTEDLSEALIAPHVGDPHGDLPTPIGGELRAHWAVARAHFHDGQRYLGGRPLEPTWLRQCLREGLQPWRRAAAIELHRASARGRLFPVLAPGPIQAALLRTRPIDA